MQSRKAWGDDGMNHKRFYDREEWQRLRFKVLRAANFTCQACGATRATGAIIQGDHIKPISIYPELALVESNIQALCRDCNMGKSNQYEDDFRPRPNLVKASGSWDHNELGRVVKTLRIAILDAEKAGDTKTWERLLMAYQDACRAIHSGVHEGEALQQAVKEIVRAALGDTPEAVS